MTTTAIGSSAKREVSIQDQDPLKLIPHGDRLLVEVVAVDDSIPMADGKKLLIERDDFDRGWAAGVVINVGNGHRLDVPDQAVALATEIDVDDKGNPVNVHPFLRIADPKTRTAVAMMPSTVPMPFARGMVVMCARYAGSDIKLRGKDYKIITQAHVIAVFTGIKMQVGEPPEPLPIVEMSANGEAEDDADG
jgi:hypothetical protein